MLRANRTALLLSCTTKTRQSKRMVHSTHYCVSITKIFIILVMGTKEGRTGAHEAWVTHLNISMFLGEKERKICTAKVGRWSVTSSRLLCRIPACNMAYCYTPLLVVSSYVVQRRYTYPCTCIKENLQLVDSISRLWMLCTNTTRDASA